MRAECGSTIRQICIEYPPPRNNLLCRGYQNEQERLPSPGKLQARGEARAAVRLQCAVRTLDKMKPKAKPKEALQFGNSRELCRRIAEDARLLKGETQI